MQSVLSCGKAERSSELQTVQGHMVKASCGWRAQTPCVWSTTLDRSRQKQPAPWSILGLDTLCSPAPRKRRAVAAYSSASTVSLLRHHSKGRYGFVGVFWRGRGGSLWFDQDKRHAIQSAGYCPAFSPMPMPWDNCNGRLGVKHQVTYFTHAQWILISKMSYCLKYCF